ncbi:hypothetical protein [Pseudomonas sp. B22129]|uniref:hypothetical protein n=1 Tax=Pseudomonas sp. B22129 TaxID=3235111 RepID=UPI003782DA0D
MKYFLKIVAMLILTLPFFAYASDGAEALQIFHERTRAFFVQQQAEIAKHEEKDREKAEQEKKKQLAPINRPTRNPKIGN